MDYDPSNEEHLSIMSYLLEEGAAILSGIDEDGEAVYMFDMEILEEVMPELHQSMVDDIDAVLLDLYERELIEISYDEDLNAMMKMLPGGKEALLEAGFHLDDSEEDD